MSNIIAISTRSHEGDILEVVVYKLGWAMMRNNESTLFSPNNVKWNCLYREYQER